MATPANRQRIELETADVELDGDGVVVVRMKPGVVADEGATRAVIEAQIELCPTRAPVLVDTRGVKSMSRAGQEMAAGPELEPYVDCLAIVVDGAVSVVLANVYLYLVRPPFPTRMFRHERTARAWLGVSRRDRRSA